MKVAVQVKNDFSTLIDRVQARFPAVAVSHEEFDSGTMSVYFDLPDGSFVELEYSSVYDLFGLSRVLGPDRIFTGHDEVFATISGAETRLLQMLAEAIP